MPFNVGDKVKIPTTKSCGVPLSDVTCISRARMENQNFLYIVTIEDYEGATSYRLSNTFPTGSSAAFREYDLVHYEGDETGGITDYDVVITNPGSSYSHADIRRAHIPYEYAGLPRAGSGDYESFRGKIGKIVFQKSRPTNSLITLFTILTNDNKIIICSIGAFKILDERSGIMPFALGQTVRVEGRVGTVRHLPSNGIVGVDMGLGFEGHNLNSNIETDTGFYYPPSIISPAIERPEPEMPFTVGMKVKLPATKKGGDPATNCHHYRWAVSNNQPYLYIVRIDGDGTAVLNRASGVTTGNFYLLTELEPYFDENPEFVPYEYNLVVDTLTEGKRVKCSVTGATHEFRPITTVIHEDDNIIKGKDDTGWYLEIVKAPFRKPRGERTYTQYIAICPEKVEEYLSSNGVSPEEQERRSTLLAKVAEYKAYQVELQRIITEQHERYEAEQRRIQEERGRVERERQERERREREERERVAREARERAERETAEIMSVGIWCHHAR